MILDALGYKLTDHACYLFSSPKRRAGQADAQPEDYVNLPLLGSAPLAAALCKTVRRHHFVDHGHVFSISERNAQVALVHLKSLLEGPWKRVRQVVLSACRTRNRQDAPPAHATADGAGGRRNEDDGDGDDNAGGPPSRWDPAWVQRLAWEAQFPAEYFSHCPGRDLLAITRKMLKTDFNILPSLLQVRVRAQCTALPLSCIHLSPHVELSRGVWCRSVSSFTSARCRRWTTGGPSVSGPATRTRTRSSSWWTAGGSRTKGRTTATLRSVTTAPVRPPPGQGRRPPRPPCRRPGRWNATWRSPAAPSCCTSGCR